MTQIAVIKMVVDCLLVAAIVLLAIRSLRAGNGAVLGANAAGVAARELRDLEISLKTLLRDADISSHGLNSSLSRQQRNLEQLLSDIATTETRIATAIDAANRDATRMRAEAHVDRENLNAERSTEINAEISARTTVANQRRATQEPQARVSAKPYREPVAREGVDRAGALAAGASSSAPALNVFGEPIHAATMPEPMALAAADSRLRQQVQRSSAAAPRSSAAVVSTPTPVARAAAPEPSGPELPRAPLGQTKAPIYRQQRLAQSVEVERAVASVSEAQESIESLMENPAENAVFTTEPLPVFIPEGSSQQIQLEEPGEPEARQVLQQDPRLGVLSSIRRHTQVL